MKSDLKLTLSSSHEESKCDVCENVPFHEFHNFGKMAEHFTLSINKLDFLLSFRTASTDSLCDGFQHPSQSLGREPRRPSRRIQKDLRLPDSSLPKGFKDRRVEAHQGNPTIAGAPGIASTQAHMARYVHLPGFFSFDLLYEKWVP